LHVVLVRTLVPDAVASGEVVSGVREALARAGALEAGAAYPRAEIEVLGVDDGSDGIAVRDGGALSRGTHLSIAARAWIKHAPEAPAEGDTGDLRAEDVIPPAELVSTTTGVDPMASAFQESDALRASARRLGWALARALLRALPERGDSR
jgi:hypothetical protein